MKPRVPPRQFLMLFLPMALLIVAGAWFIGSDRIESELGLIRANEIGSVVMGVRRLDDELHLPLQQLQALTAVEAVRAAIDRPAPDTFAGMAAAFATLATYNAAIDTVRWIDENGMERVRVDQVAGRAGVVPPERLQDQKERYYFQQAIRLKPGGYYMSPLDLNVEFGQIVTPYKPLLRLATVVQDQAGQRRGILIVNIAASGLLDAFRASLIEARDHAMLVDRAGYWLASPDAEQEWGFMLPHKQSLARTWPAAWKTISAIPSGQEETADGLWTWSTVYPLKTGSDGGLADPQSWLVVTHLPDSQLALVRDRAWLQAGVIGGVLLLLFGLLAAWLARAQSGWTRAEIAATRAHVEAAAANRMREVLERFRVMMESNSNGVLVVDQEGCIVLTNPALERMFGYARAELLGQRLDMLLPEEEKRLHGEHLSAYMSSPTARPMGAGRELHGRRKDGVVFPIEVSLSPFTENGEQYVDALIADISERKRLADAGPA